MNVIKKILMTAIVCLTLMPALTPAIVSADAKSEITTGINSVGGTQSSSASDTLNTTAETIINLLSIVAGVAAVIMIIIGGFRYVTSSGNPETTKGAKNTILYAIVGLVVVALAQIIVHFVLFKVE